MDVSEAVRVAKQYIVTVLADEHPADVGLEEVAKSGTDWHVTVGFSRAWDDVKGPLYQISGMTQRRRVYKQLAIRDEDGAVVSMTNRNLDQ